MSLLPAAPGIESPKDVWSSFDTLSEPIHFTSPSSTKPVVRNRAGHLILSDVTNPVCIVLFTLSKGVRCRYSARLYRLFPFPTPILTDICLKMSRTYRRRLRGRQQQPAVPRISAKPTTGTNIVVSPTLTRQADAPTLPMVLFVFVILQPTQSPSRTTYLSASNSNRTGKHRPATACSRVASIYNHP